MLAKPNFKRINSFHGNDDDLHSDFMYFPELVTWLPDKLMGKDAGF